VRWREALLQAARLGPVLDVACGDGRNGMYLAAHGAQVLLVDISEEAHESIREAGWPERVRFSRMDLESPVPPAFEPESFGAVLVFRYLHRPLIPVLRDCLAPGGLLVYETFLEGHEAHGKPRNPEHLLRRGELGAWFGHWEVLEHFEGELAGPPRVMGRMVCRKPSAVASPPAP
jgi:SAM-dependent methyltransferase